MRTLKQWLSSIQGNLDLHTSELVASFPGMI